MQVNCSSAPSVTLRFFLWLLPLFLAMGLLVRPVRADEMMLFDGRNLDGWESPHPGVWRVEDGTIVGGSMEGNPQNEFLATTREFKHFRLRFEYRLVGIEGFINGGVQFRSQRLENPPNEMIGYQADIGAGYSGSLYDESRRRRMLVQADSDLIDQLEKPGEWNQYEVWVEGPQVRLFLNETLTVSYVEEEEGIEQTGKIALQIHGNCKAEIAFRNLMLEVLPDPVVPPSSVISSRFGEGQSRKPHPPFEGITFEPLQEGRLVWVGQENAVMEQEHGFFEALMQTAFASSRMTFRSMAWEGDTVYEQWRDLHFGPWPEQLRAATCSTLLVQYGQMEALDGLERLTEFKVAYHQLLDAFAQQTQRCILVSPIPYEDPQEPYAPRLSQYNEVLKAYAQTIESIARERGLIYLDLYTPFLDKAGNSKPMTRDGIHLNEDGLRRVAMEMARQLGGFPSPETTSPKLRSAIIAKNRLWFDAWRPANWSFAYGDRVSQRFATAAGNLPSLHGSLKQRREQIAAYDDMIHRLAFGSQESLPEYPTVGDQGVSPEALSPEEQLASFEMAEGFQAHLVASEEQDVVNPIQIAWDGVGRLYVACSPSYPQSLASVRPSDYILVLEDENGDGQADKHWRFAEGLTMIQGLEPGPGGVYACDFDQLVFLRDEDGDLRADRREVLFSGFGVGDTHQLINSISHGIDGSLWFTQGLHAMSLVETPWGIKRLDRAAVWRLRPQSMLLEGFFGGGMAGANCWGVAEDDYGQVFHKTGDRPQGYWTVPGMIRGASSMGGGSRTLANQSYAASPEQYHGVGNLFDTSPKTTSLDFVGTRAMPESIQGAALIGGYFGSVVELHQLEDDGAGFRSSQLPRVMVSSDSSFRPVDVSMGPDGAMYLADWYNRVIGHYQASYADPQRDKHHGRIWRIASTRHEPVQAPNMEQLGIRELISHLHSPERWFRHQARRRLFYLPSTAVLLALDAHRQQFAQESPEPLNERHLIEWAGVYQAHESPRATLISKMLGSHDARVRSYGVRALGGWADRLEASEDWLKKMAEDFHPRVRLEAVVACSYLRRPASIAVALKVLDHSRDRFIDYALRQTARSLQPIWQPVLREGQLALERPEHEAYLRALTTEEPVSLSQGELLYQKACLPCHQADGKGLPGFYPSLESSDWVSGDPGRLIRIVLHGLEGPITLNGEAFISKTSIAMPGFAGLGNEEIAQLLSYVRGDFGNQASAISGAQVQKVRMEEVQRSTPWKESSLR